MPSQLELFEKGTSKLSKYLRLFQEIARNAREQSKRVEGHNTVNILKVLDKIIPLDYFGTRKHRKLFYKIVELMLTRSVHECIYVRQLIRGFDLKEIPWLAEIVKQNRVNSHQLCRRYFYEAQLWLLERIVKPLIKRFYSTVKRGQTYEIELVPKPIWTSFATRVINSLKSMGHLVPPQVPQVKPRGVLQIKPKKSYHDIGDFRPIMRLIPENSAGSIQQKRLRIEYKEITKVIRTIAQRMCFTKTTNLYCKWKNYVATVGDEKVYGVKLDVKDAFGNVDIDSLCCILDTLYMCGRISIYIKDFIIRHIKYQYVSFGMTKTGLPRVWQWKHGLLQGDRLSSALCQLYMSHRDAKHLKELFKPNTFLHRTVDDYFFCSTNLNDVERFIHTMSSIHVLNTNKTESNLPTYDHNEIGYCGQIFLMSTNQVKGLHSFQKRTEIRHRFRLWNMQRPIYYKQHSQRSVEEFIKRSMIFTSNNYRFKNMELNTAFNTENTVLQNYFEAMVFLAFKFDAAFMAVYHGVKDFHAVATIIKKTVYKYAQKALGKLRKNQGQYFTGLFSLELFLKIGIQAFVLVLKKRQLYSQHQILYSVQKYMKNIFVKNIKQTNFHNFKRLPPVFSNISMQRRLPHHKDHRKHEIVTE